MTEFGKRRPGGRRAAPRTQAPLVVELAIGERKQFATLSEISRTGAKLSGVSSLTEGEELLFKASNVRALGEVVWCEGSECAIAFDVPIAVAEVSRLRALANFVTSARQR
jgi:hypothetical protein